MEPNTFEFKWNIVYSLPLCGWLYVINNVASLVQFKPWRIRYFCQMNGRTCTSYGNKVTNVMLQLVVTTDLM